VSGDVHTNTIEGFWGLLKRGLGGVYHSVSDKHLQTYLDEYVFRYNNRDAGGRGMFTGFLDRVEREAQPRVSQADAGHRPTSEQPSGTQS
jgi:ISXO2-like transposase domain